MGQWYCHTGGQQYGPIEEFVLRQWIAEGRVRPEDLVWSPGMPAWQPVVSTFLWSGGQWTSSLVPPSPGGTGGRGGVFGILGLAWRTMSGRWGLAIGFLLLYWLITQVPQNIPYLGVLVSMAMLFLMGAFELGLAVFFLHYIRRGSARIEMMFWGFRCYAGSLGAFWWMILLVAGWMACGLAVGALGGLVAYLVTAETEPALITGGIMAGLLTLVLVIIAELRYSQTWFILADNPHVGAIEAVRQSTLRMRGHKLRLFGLGLVVGLIYLPSVVILGGGILLAALNETSPGLGILVAVLGGLLFIATAFVVSPWATTAMAVFYQDLLPPPTVAGGTGIAPVAGPVNPYGG